MRILIVSKFFPPENSIASLRPYSWAKYWSRAGHDVTVLTTVKPGTKTEDLKIYDVDKYKLVELNYNSIFYKLQNIYLNKLKVKNESSNGILNSNQIEKSTKEQSSFSLKNSLKILNNFRLNRGLLSGQRMPDIMDFWINPALQWAKTNGPWDLVVSTYAPYACHVIAYNLKKEQIAKQWIADFRDLWTDHHNFKGLFPFTYVERNLERLLMKQTDAITTVSKPLVSTLGKKYGEQKVHVIENGFDSEDLHFLPKDKIFQDNKVRIIHTGTVYPGKMDPSLLFEVISSIASDNELKKLLENLEVLFVGANSDKVVAQAVKMNVDRWVKNGGFLPREDILRMQREAHILLFLGFEKSKTAGLLSGKLYEYLFSETPIWAIDVDYLSSPGQIILESNTGVIFGENKKMLQNYLVKLLQSSGKQKAYPNKEVLSNFERSNLAKRMLELVKEKT